MTGKEHLHSGIDIPMRLGTVVLASRGGHVLRIDQDGVGKGEINGNAIHIRDDRGLRWSYLHLSQVGVKLGQWVRQGSVIGAVGSTGRSTGPHLHLQVARPDGAIVDPVTLFPAGTFSRL